MEAVVFTPTSSLVLTDPFRVGDWLADPMSNRLTRGEEEKRVEPKVMEVLACMAVRAGDTVSREVFMDEVWTGTIVTDDVLARCISELRKALGDRASDPKYVETIRKRGYVLIAPVQLGVDETPPERTPSEFRSSGGDGASALIEPAPSALISNNAARRRRPIFIGAGILGAVVVLGAAFGLLGSRETAKPLPVLPVTTLPGEERDPAVSPDGKSIAFVWDDGSGFDLYVQDIGSDNLRRLTLHPGDERNPAWSPDGRRLAFAQCGVGGCGVSIVDAGGGAVMPLLPSGDLRIQNLTWSPDGEVLTLSARMGGTGAFSLHMLSLDGSPTTQLTAPASAYPGDLNPAYSPDGRWLAFIRTALDGRQDVCVVASTGGEVRRLAQEQRGVTGIAWTTGGDEIVYAANRDGVAGLWRVATSGGDPEWVALSTDGGEISELSIRGSVVAFSRQITQTQLLALTTGEPNGRLLAPSTRDDTQPSLSPDASRLAFVSTRSGRPEVWLADSNGGAARRLTDGVGERINTPRWAPDGAQLTFSARSEGDANIYVTGTSGGLRKLTNDPADDIAPSWSRDGKWVYFASNRGGTWQIYRAPSGGGEAEPLTIHGGIAAGEAPDGKLLVIRPDTRGLWVLPNGDNGLPRDQGAERLQLRLAPSDWANWTVSGDAIYALERRYDGQGMVIRYDYATGERSEVGAAPRVPEKSGLTVDASGRLIILSQRDPSGSDIVRVQGFE